MAQILTKTATVEPTVSQEQISPERIPPYKRFEERLNHGKAVTRLIRDEDALLANDLPAIEYFNHMRTIRGNDRRLSPNTQRNAISAFRNFLLYTDIQITTRSVHDLVLYKRSNPRSTNVEQAMRAFSLEEPIKQHHSQAT